MCNNSCGNNCWWIIILILLFCNCGGSLCGGNSMCSGCGNNNYNSCGCNNGCC